jgi:hypothetical protein
MADHLDGVVAESGIVRRFDGDFGLFFPVLDRGKEWLDGYALGQTLEFQAHVLIEVLAPLDRNLDDLALALLELGAKRRRAKRKGIIRLAYNGSFGAVCPRLPVKAEASRASG